MIRNSLGQQLLPFFATFDIRDVITWSSDSLNYFLQWCCSDNNVRRKSSLIEVGIYLPDFLYVFKPISPAGVLENGGFPFRSPLCQFAEVVVVVFKSSLKTLIGLD